MVGRRAGAARARRSGRTGTPSSPRGRRRSGRHVEGEGRAQLGQPPGDGPEPHEQHLLPAQQARARSQHRPWARPARRADRPAPAAAGAPRRAGTPARAGRRARRTPASCLSPGHRGWPPRPASGLVSKAVYPADERCTQVSRDRPVALVGLGLAEGDVGPGQLPVGRPQGGVGRGAGVRPLQPVRPDARLEQRPRRRVAAQVAPDGPGRPGRHGAPVCRSTPV